MRTLADVEQKRLLIERIMALSLTDQRRWGRMSVDGMVCHLADSFSVALCEAPASEDESGPMRRALMKQFALYVPMQWPKGIPTRPEVEQGMGGTPPGDFEVDRTRLLHFVDRFCEERSMHASHHPMFGGMKRADWMRWGYLHTDHHLRQFGR